MLWHLYCRLCLVITSFNIHMLPSGRSFQILSTMFDWKKTRGLLLLFIDVLFYECSQYTSMTEMGLWLIPVQSVHPIHLTVSGGTLNHIFWVAFNTPNGKLQCLWFYLWLMALCKCFYWLTFLLCYFFTLLLIVQHSFTSFNNFILHRFGILLICCTERLYVCTVQKIKYGSIELDTVCCSELCLWFTIPRSFSFLGRIVYA